MTEMTMTAITITIDDFDALATPISSERRHKALTTPDREQDDKVAASKRQQHPAQPGFCLYPRS
jgi:hypothetical protein